MSMILQKVLFLTRRHFFSSEILCEVSTMIRLFFELCYYITIWPFVMSVKLITLPFRLMLWFVLLPFRLIDRALSLPGRILSPSRNRRNDDTMDDFLDWVEEYECLTDDD